ncbi:hypothetical protein BU26DRAFT_608984 [Trematosphaeria pertusa]|uniref:G-patch domain-containing protein n=1 Tax=Trematosphaeria pertusa TaxID=390896 RepID=A0A6A6HZG3_9PLEO|nr:uncharacterized protein BU26DRAFT_608984 [Trematosphaeria pertusa]KAF2243624.1 hypothetical protein BU26DRAFT_608984 [Trematosphaeria pertusa]
MENQQKRKHNFRQEPRKKPKSDNEGGSFSGLGAKLMSKMGWKEGQGLGREKQGMSEPIQVTLRGTRGGVGAVKEKSEQQIREERRKAELNGETYVEDSEEEERMQRRKKKSTAASTAAPKPKKTIFDLEAAGMQVPRTLQSIVDATTGQATSTSALRLRGDEIPFQTSLAGRVQREVAAFGEAVDAIQTDSKNIEFEMDRLYAELEGLSVQIAEIQDISARLEALRTEKDFSAVCDGLKALRAAYPSKDLQREAVAAIHSHFTSQIAGWTPASDPLEHVACSLSEVRGIIDPSTQAAAAEYQPPSSELARPISVFAPYPHDNEYRNRRSTTLYQSMMLSWWPHFHTAMINDLELEGPSAAAFIRAIEVWKPVLPPFIFQRVTKEIKRKVSAALQQWNPRKAIKHKSSSPLPNWVFDWLPYDSDMLSEAMPKLRSLVQLWPVQRGVIPGIQLWKKAFPGEIEQLLVKQLLPRLAAYLRDDFEFNPAEQNLEPISAITSWCGVLPARIIAELLHAEFFASKFFHTLHSWLTFEGRNFEEIGEWLSWWKKSVFPEEINEVAIIERDWEEAYKLVIAALDLEGPELEKLTLPAAAEPRHSPSPETPQFSKSINTEPPRSARQEIEETTFKDVVEAWCAEENLLLIPLRKADEKTGQPLFRITASATGKGGVVAYMKGDVIWAQNKKDKSVWEPVGLEEGLVARAEGK